MADILIIGGGVAGLSAGIYASISGHRVTICEKHAIPGGNLSGWDRQGYHIDNCIHWLTGTNPAADAYHMWQVLGALGETGIYQPESLYTYVKDGRSLTLWDNLDRLAADMRAASPKDEKEIAAFLEAVRLFQGFLGVAGPGQNEKNSLPALIKGAPLLWRYWQSSVQDVAMRFKDPLIRGFFRSFLGKNFSSLAFVMVVATFTGGNGALPKGGSAAMAGRITDRFLSLGGKLLCRQEAVDVKAAPDGVTVTFADGSVRKADYLIATPDPAVVFEKLLHLPLPKTLAKQYADPAMRRYSAMQTAFACDIEALPFRNDLIFEISPAHREALHGKTLIAREFSHEPSFAPAGKTVLQTMMFCRENTAKSYLTLAKNREAYAAEKKRLLAHTEAALVEQCPSLAGHLTPLDCWTPATYHRYTGAQVGSFMAFTMAKRHSFAACDNREGCPDRVILAGQWLHAPGGLPIAASSGRKAAKAVDLLEQKRLKAR